MGFCAQVLGRGRTSDFVIHRADARWLDSCDEHRNEGGRGGDSTHIYPSIVRSVLRSGGRRR
ncbi:hypothetical protein CO655_28710 [Rhizobium sp. M1]|nr:hypothetical protein CO655_28710 [Rhizobium sp. M1]